MICMNAKRGRPATGRNPKGVNGSYYVIDPTNYSRYLKRTNEQRLLDAYNYIYEQAFGKPMGWKVQKDFYELNIKGV